MTDKKCFIFPLISQNACSKVLIERFGPNRIFDLIYFLLLSICAQPLFFISKHSILFSIRSYIDKANANKDLKKKRIFKKV